MTEIKIRHEKAKTDRDAVEASALSDEFPFINKSHLIRLTYFILGLFLFFSVLIIFNVYVIHLKIESSVVSAPIETMVSPAAGYIKDIYVTAGMKVKKGDVLMKIENIDLERDRQLAVLQVSDSKLTVTYLQNLFANEQQKLNVYKTIGSNRVESSQATVDLTEQELHTAQNNLGRMQTLFKKHYITIANMEDAVTKLKGAEEKMKNATAEHNIQSHALGAVQNGLYFTGDKIEGSLGELSAQIEAAQKRLNLNEERVKVYEDMLQKLTLVAPFDGKITQVLKSVGNTTDSVKPLILLAKTEAPKTVVVYMTQDEITHVSINGRVKIYIPSLGKSYHGKLSSLDRTSGFVDEVNAQYRWRDLKIDRSAVAIIAIEAKEQKDFNRHVLSGLPAIVYFSRKFTLL